VPADQVSDLAQRIPLMTYSDVSLWGPAPLAIAREVLMIRNEPVIAGVKLQTEM
jgi:hypothetical protein